MIIKKYFFALITTLFFTLPVNAAYCPSPEAIKPGCKSLVTEAMVKTTIMERLKEYNLEKLDNQVVKNITQEINANPRSFYRVPLPRRHNEDPFNPLVLFIGEQLNIHVSVYSNNGRKIRSMLVHLLDKAGKACRYTNTHLNLIGLQAIELQLNRIKNFEAAYFFSNATNPAIKGTLTRCAYRLADGRGFDLIDNDQKEYKPQFRLNDDYRKHWNVINNRGVYKCEGNTVKNCSFKLES